MINPQIDGSVISEIQHAIREGIDQPVHWPGSRTIVCDLQWRSTLPIVIKRSDMLALSSIERFYGPWIESYRDRLAIV